MPIAAALVPVVIYLWFKGSDALKRRLQDLPPSWWRTVLLWPSKGRRE